MKRKINFSIILLLLCVFKMQAGGGWLYDGIWYHFNSDRTALVTYERSYQTGTTLSGEGIYAYESNYTGDVVIPEYVSQLAYDAQSKTYITIQYRVVGITDHAFYNCTGLTSVTIPNTITNIGQEAFCGCSNLTSINIPNGSIEEAAFKDCNNLTSVAIGSGVTSIGDMAFGYCNSLASITVDNGISSIGNKAFCGCNNLTSVAIPNSVINIGDAVFSSCNNLTSVTIGNGIQTIGSRAFYSCNNLSVITLGNNSALSFGQDAFYNCNALSSVYICDINAWCKSSFSNNDANPLFYAHHLFLNNNEVTNVIIPNSIIHLGRAFCGCRSLVSVTIPNSVKSIANYAFYGCSNITSINIPEGVTSIGNFAFEGCSSLTSITIPEEVNTLGVGGTFKNCTALNTVHWNAISCDVNNNANGSHNSPFENCGVTNFIFGENVQTVPKYLCEGLNMITSIVIPKSVTWIGPYAFSDCGNLTSVVWNAKNCRPYASYYPQSTAPDYSSPFGGIISLVFGDEVEKIPEFLCHGQNIISIVIPSSVTNIGSGAFASCMNLKSVDIMGQIKSIQYYTFAKCSNLETMIIPEGVTSIGERAFLDCWLRSLSIPESVTYIGEEALQCYIDTMFVKASQPAGTEGISSLPPNNGINCICVPCGCVGIYQRASGWNRLSDVIQNEPATARSLSADSIKGIVSPIESVCDTRIKATANYGYHFTQWNDGNTNNPRTIDPTEDVTYTAEFAPNQYIVTLECNEEQGIVEGAGTFDYLTKIKISAKPNDGYHFVKWSDNDESATRTIEVDRDISLTALFEENLSAIGDVKLDKTSLRKVLINGQLFILRDGKIYTLQGQKVK